MRVTDSLPRKFGAAVIAGLVALGPAAAQPLFNPEVGQAGKDVIWVPTADALVEKMLDWLRSRATTTSSISARATGGP
jgi:hypothetical protein